MLAIPALYVVVLNSKTNDALTELYFSVASLNMALYTECTRAMSLAIDWRDALLRMPAVGSMYMEIDERMNNKKLMRDVGVTLNRSFKSIAYCHYMAPRVYTSLERYMKNNKIPYIVKGGSAVVQCKVGIKKLLGYKPVTTDVLNKGYKKIVNHYHRIQRVIKYHVNRIDAYIARNANGTTYPTLLLV